MWKKSLILGALCALVIVCGNAAWAQAPEQMRIAAASDLRFVLEEVVTLFREENRGAQSISSGNSLPTEVTYGSSGLLYSQIVNGAPYDLFLSADGSYAEQLISKGMVQRSDAFEYGYGQLSLWTLKETAQRLKFTQSDWDAQGLAILLNPKIQKIAIANPAHAPYGKAAVQALSAHPRIYDRIRPKLVFAENISQAAQFVEARVADVGILAVGLVRAPQLQQKGIEWIVPADDYHLLNQTGVILKRNLSPSTAERFKAFLLSSRAQAIFARYGYVPPHSSILPMDAPLVRQAGK